MTEPMSFPEEPEAPTEKGFFKDADGDWHYIEPTDEPAKTTPGAVVLILAAVVVIGLVALIATAG